MPQKLLYNFPIHAFIIFKGTTKNRIATAIIYSAAILFPCYRACVYFKSVVRLWYLQKGNKKAPNFQRIIEENQKLSLVTRTGIEPMLQP